MTFATFITSIVNVMNTYVIPLIVGLAILAFIWNAARYFIFAGDSEDARAKGRQSVIWGVFGIVALLALWGIVNALLSTLNLG